jgi:hypothetical protein
MEAFGAVAPPVGDARQRYQWQPPLRDLLASHTLALAARALIRAVCRYRLFNFRSESIQVFGRFGEHFSFSIGDKIT